MKFSDLGLSEEVLRAVSDAGYTVPTPIQEKAIPYILQGKDILGIAQTGTGKTAGFTLPMIDILWAGRARARMPRTLILEPTRELAAQVADSFDTYGKYHKLSQALLIGGVSFEDQNRKLSRGVDVLIATPGRLLDHFERGKLMLTGVKILVIDEADRMLDMGFIPDVERICKLIPGSHQTLFFSATMPPEIKRLVNVFLKSPVEIKVAPPATASENVIQEIAVVGQRDKEKALMAIMGGQNVSSAIIFCNRKRDVDSLHRSLAKAGYSAAALHGDLAQSYRMEVLANFKEGKTKFLVASDVAARGLDIPNVSHVINFDVPTQPDDYIHRIGRTARAGKSGHALTLATPAEGKFVAAIEQLLGNPIPRIDVSGLGGLTLEEGDERPHGRRRGGRRGRGKTTPRDNAGPSGRPAPKAKPAPRPDPKNQKSQSPPPPPDRKPQSTGDGKAGMGDHVPAFLLREVRPKK